MKTRNRLLALVLIFYACSPASLTFGQEDESLSNFDRRLELASRFRVLDLQRQVAAEQLRARIPGVQIDLDDVVAAPKWIHNKEGFLTGPDFFDAPPLPPTPGQ